MRLASVALKLPSLRVTNDDILARVAALNSSEPALQLRRYSRELRYLLERSGAQVRYVRDRARGERALPLILDACREALREAAVEASDLDLLMYCGVGRGFLEPATAYFVARSLGLSCQCFDVLDACMSWVRALQIAQGFQESGTYRNILLVNGEFNVLEHGDPELLVGISRDRLRYTFPAFTVGEAATASLLTPDGPHWNFHFRSDPARANLCALPLEGYCEYSEPGDRLALNGTGKFVSYGQELLRTALEGTVAFIRDTYPDPAQFDLWFPHAASAEMCRQAEVRLELRGKVVYETFPLFGNLVSATIPAAIRLAEQQGRLRRGHRIVLCPASAGMSFGLADLVY